MRNYSAKRPGKRTRVLDPVMKPKPPLRAIAELADPVRPLNIGLDDLEWGKCHEVTQSHEWGRPRYCGHVAHTGSRFCAGHHARNFVEIPKPKRQHRGPHYDKRPENYRDSVRFSAR
jgi:hypothetical protein